MKHLKKRFYIVDGNNKTILATITNTYITGKIT